MKLCPSIFEDPTGKTNPDGWPTLITEMIWCPKTAKCCGVPNQNEENEIIPEEGCCNC